jgi:hypothetical protein
MGASRAGSYEVTPSGRSRAITSSVGPTDRPKDSNQRVRLTVSQTRRETPHPSSLACGSPVSVGQVDFTLRVINEARNLAPP